MHRLFLICATIGGTILILRVALSLVGIGFDGLGDSAGDLETGIDADAGTDSGSVGHGGHSDLGRLFTFQAIVAFLAFFGVGGLAALDSGQSSAIATLIGSVTGVAAVAVLGSILRSLRRLHSDGTVRIADAVGLEGRVYLRIPGHGGGEGKITLPIQGRTIEVQARTAGPALASGEPVVVSRIIDERIVEVVTPKPQGVKKSAIFAD